MSATQPDPYPGAGFQVNGGSVDIGQSLPSLPDLPLVVGDGDSADTSVDTTSLKTFANNLDTLAGDVGDARNQLANLDTIRAGGADFVEAESLKGKITDLQQNYLQSLDALETALKRAAEGITDIATNYSTIEDVNDKAGSDLTVLIQQAQSDLQTLQSDVSGAGATTTVTAPSTGDSSSTDSGSSGTTTTS